MKAVGIGLLLAGWMLLPAQKRAIEEPAEEAPVDFVCPMDPDVRAREPGRCPRCGMKLVAGIAEPIEYPVHLELRPEVPWPGKPLRMIFHMTEPEKGATVEHFEIVHEKLFHLFLVSEDLSYFAHEHPQYRGDGHFTFDTVLPQPGNYRVVADYYPRGATPQINTLTLVAPGKAPAKKPLVADSGPQRGVNLEAELTTEPKQPLAGFKTLLFFRLKPLEGEFQLEPYLAAWGHMLAASEDLIDLMHAHPFIADGGPQVQFNLIFPRAGMHRVWVQFQSRGKVNTFAFNVRVKPLE